VAAPQDVQAIERSGAFRGRYHVLRGVLDPARDIGPEQLKINELFERIKTSAPPITEIILALNPDLPGETTTLYLTKQLKAYAIRITRLARGLPLGSDLDYADEITLMDALKGRQTL
ncbi:MAG: toprim domain-containing protein, partial [Patescibacteria group bacterium]